MSVANGWGCDVSELLLFGLTHEQVAEAAGDTFIDWRKVPPDRQWEIIFGMLAELGEKMPDYGEVPGD